MSLIEIVIAVFVVGIIAVYISYVLSFFTAVIPIQFIYLIMFIIAVDIVLFVIHRRS